MIDTDMLAACGIDAGNGMRLCGGDGEFYETMLRLLAEDTEMPDTDELLAEGRWDDLLLDANGIQGMSGQVSAGPLYESASEVVSLIRSGRYERVPEACDRMRRDYDRTLGAIRDAVA